VNCYLTELNLSACPVTSCMYNEPGGGCVKHTESGISIPVSHERVARAKGIPLTLLEESVEKANKNIQRMIVLDRYRDFLQTTSWQSWISSRKIERILMGNLDLQVAGFTDARMVIAAASNKNWRLFNEGFAGELSWGRKTLMRLRTKQWELLRESVKDVVCA